MDDCSIMTDPTPLRTEIVRDFSRLEALSAQWERLWKVSPVREAFTMFPWTRASWRAYGSHRTLCTPIVYRDNAILGILPLAAERRCLQFIGAPRSDYNDLLCAESDAVEVLEAAFTALLKRGIPWDLCRLENLPHHSNIVKYYKAVKVPPRCHLQLWFRDFAPTLEMSAAHKEGIIKAILSKKRLQKRTRRLDRAGALRFRHLEDRQDIINHLPEFFGQHMARMPRAGKKSLFCHPNARHFYKALIEEFDPRQELRFAVLELDNRPIAYHFGFEVNGKFTLYKPTFDVGFWTYSPGEVLLTRLFEYISTCNINEFDFTVGNEPYKSRFANQVHHNFTLYFFPPGLRGRLRKYAIEITERARKHPKM
jgi:CelD/BcsL family acetyltransferase involved in cellulose biosynthesis